MIWGGYRNVAAGWDDTVQLMPVTQGQIFLVIPIAGVLILIYSIIHIIDTLHAPADSFQPVSEENMDISQLTDEGI